MQTFTYFITFYVIFTGLIGIGYTRILSESNNNVWWLRPIEVTFAFIVSWLVIPVKVGKIINQILND